MPARTPGHVPRQDLQGVQGRVGVGQAGDEVLGVLQVPGPRRPGRQLAEGEALGLGAAALDRDIKNLLLHFRKEY